MAKAGFWLRGSRGKLAGASMAKGANGQTIIREIVTPKNPQTQAQMIQRVIMKTIMTAYSRMKAITDHSFEGISPGRDTMAEFMRINLNRLRENVAVEIANGRGLDDIYAFTPLKSETFSPNGYIISKGSLPIVNAVANRTPGYTASIEAITGNTYGDVISSLGLQRGDQLTFISIQGTNPQNAEFFFARVILDPRNEDGTEAPLTTEFINDGTIVLPNPRNEGTFNTLTFDTDKITYGFNRRPMLDCGIIVSRRDASGQWMRSDCTLSTESANIIMFNSLGECLAMLESEDIQTSGGRYLNQAGRSRTATMESAPAAGTVTYGFFTDSNSYESGSERVSFTTLLNEHAQLIKVNVAGQLGVMTKNAETDIWSLETNAAAIAGMETVYAETYIINAVGSSVNKFTLNNNGVIISFENGAFTPEPAEFSWGTVMELYELTANAQTRTKRQVIPVGVKNAANHPVAICDDGNEYPLMCANTLFRDYGMVLVNGTIGADDGAWGAAVAPFPQTVIGWEEPCGACADTLYANGISPLVWVRNP